jgi:hypothetical protein
MGQAGGQRNAASAQRQFSGQFQGGSGAPNRFPQQQRGGAGNQAAGQVRRYRPVIQVAFAPLVAAPDGTDVPPPAAPQLPVDVGFDNLKVSLKGGVATLNGEVASRDDAELAVAIIALEPGVQSVRNQIAVKPAK